MRSQSRTLVIIGIGILVGLCLLSVALVLLAAIYLVPVSRSTSFLPSRYESNGQRIYFTATSESGDPITADISAMHQMGSGHLACVDCHRPDGRGGTVQMMMAAPVEAPDIRYITLTSTEHNQGNEEDHPPYTDETLKRAITEGIDPAGEPLEWPMPRWEMSERDLSDLIDYLKTLK